MIPDSIILLDSDRRLDVRLDVLLEALEDSRKRLEDCGWHVDADKAWDDCGAAWEALHGELMNQVDRKPAKALKEDADK